MKDFFDDDAGSTPAFPTMSEQTFAEGHVRYEYSGLSLRDYFAAAAMTGVVNVAAPAFINGMAKSAYAFADVMLAARKENEKEFIEKEEHEPL